MPCLELPYHPEIPALSLLAIMLRLHAHHHSTATDITAAQTLS